MRVHVVGGSGFTGQYVVKELALRGHEVLALARSKAAAETVEAVGAEPVIGDLDDPASLVAAFQRGNPDGLINVASLGFGHAPAIVAAAEEAPFSRAVFVSTTALFTRLNASSKTVRRAAERSVEASDLDWTIIRPTMIYGTPGDRNIARLLRLLRRTPVMPVPGGGRRLQQPLHVEDLVHVIVAAFERDVAIGRAYDVAGPEPLALSELVRLGGRAVGREPRLLPIPLGPTVVAARLYERLSRSPRIKAEQLERLAEDKAFDIEDARRDLGFSPRSFRDGVAAEAAMLT